MIDVLIPIKEFPCCCGLCPCFHAETPMYCQADKTIKMTAPYGKRMEGCPLIKIKEGKWIELAENVYECSVCGEAYILDDTPTAHNYHFCPNCGAGMEASR